MPEVRKTVTALFADVVASTELGERLDAETLRDVITRYFAEMADVIEAHGGTVEKFVGDAVMAVFGVPAAHEDDALRAVRAAMAMQARMRELNREVFDERGARLLVRIGINTGEVIAGDPTAGHGFVTGDPLNLAKRLEQAAAPGEVLVGETTARLVSHAVVLTATEPLPAKGKRERVLAYRVDEVDPTSDALPRNLEAPLVGRAAELRAIRFAYTRAVESRSPQLATVVGDAGIGKSRLVREFLAGVQDEATVLVGRCPPYGEGITFWPVRDVLPGEPLDGTSEEIFWRVRERLQEIARSRPLVVCFEDVHWGEATFLDLVQYLAGWIRDAPVLLLCLARPELLERRPDWAMTGQDTMSLRLDRLGAEEAKALLDHLGAPTELRAQIVDAAGGNPLFVEQMAAMAADAGNVEAIPPTIRSLLTARLDRLAEDERAVIDRAAVVGREFPLRAVVELTPPDRRDRVSRVLLALVRKELVRPQAGGADDRLRFRHALIRDAAYEAIPKVTRAELHERYADWLEETGGSVVVVGYHLEQAVRLQRELALPGARSDELALRAGRLIAEVGRRAFGRDDVPAAINLLGRATALLEGHAEQLAEPLTALATTLGTAGRFDEAEATLERALEAARATGSRRSELRALLLREQLRLYAGRTSAEACAQFAREAVPELEELGEDLGLALAWRLASGTDVAACRWADRVEKLERALRHARRVPEAAQERSSLVAVLAQALYYGPVCVDDVLARYDALLEEAGPDPSARAALLAHRGGMLAMRGEVAEARRMYEDSTGLHEELGLRFRGAVMSLVGAEIEWIAGDHELAEAHLRSGCETLDAIGAGGVRAALVAFLAELLSRDGRDEEAEVELEVLAEIAEPGDVFADVLRAAVSARLEARRGSRPAAHELAREAVSKAAATDFPALQALAAVALSDVARAAGDDDARRSALQQAAAAYLRKGSTAQAAPITAELAARSTRP